MEQDAQNRLVERWSTQHGGTEGFSPQVYWLAVPEVDRRLQRLLTGGASEHWVNYCLSEFLGGRTPAERMASLGCGTGALERHLASLRAFRRCDAYDLAPAALEVARREAAAGGFAGIHYELANIEQLVLDQSAYDAIWFNGSLHHVSNLETVCDRVAAALKPGGFMFANEYVGASRFDFPTRQAQAIRAAFALIPAKWRRWFANGTAGPVATDPCIPDPRVIEAADPSEAVRSSDILQVVADRFEIVARHDAAGGLLQFLLHGIAGNFRAEDSGSMVVLQMLFDIEDGLTRAGDLPSDIVLLVARRR